MPIKTQIVELAGMGTINDDYFGGRELYSIYKFKMTLDCLIN
jgi:hypothetical protein